MKSLFLTFLFICLLCGRGYGLNKECVWKKPYNPCVENKVLCHHFLSLAILCLYECPNYEECLNICHSRIPVVNDLVQHIAEICDYWWKKERVKNQEEKVQFIQLYLFHLGLNVKQNEILKRRQNYQIKWIKYVCVCDW